VGDPGPCQARRAEAASERLAAEPGPAKLKAEHGSPEADRGKALAELEAVKDEGEELIVRLLALLARGPPLRSVSLLTQPTRHSR
jgi:hypothetical protein